MKVHVKEQVIRFSDELLLYSGQYALFYILMNFSKESLNYFRTITDPYCPNHNTG